MPRRIIDISVALENDIPADPPIMRPAIRYTDHHAGFAAFAQLLPGLSQRANRNLPEPSGCIVGGKRVIALIDIEKEDLPVR